MPMVLERDIQQSHMAAMFRHPHTFSHVVNAVCPGIDATEHQQMWFDTGNW